LIGFKPRWGFAEGIREFLAWSARQGVGGGGYESALEEMKGRGLLLTFAGGSRLEACSTLRRRKDGDCC
jgi:hypothetical protein